MLILIIAVYSVVYFAVMAGILFGTAGRIDLPMFWAYIVVMVAIALIAAARVYRRNPDLIKEQMKPRGDNQDKLTKPMLAVCLLAHFVIAGLDVGRYHWSDSVPFWLQVVGLIGFGCGYSLVAWSTIINQFYSSAVRLQADRGQAVITSGPYRFVRHPGYIGWIMFFVFSGLALGSWLSALPMLILVALILRRTVIEDRMLRSGLTGYAEYARSVPFRLIPGVW